MTVFLPRDKGGYWGSTPYSLCVLLWVTGISLKGVVHISRKASFVAAAQRLHSLFYTALVAIRIYICWSHKTVANKESVLNQLSLQGLVQREQT